MKIIFYIILFFQVSCLSATANNKSIPIIYKIDINKEIGPTTWIYLSKGLAEAKKLKANAILIHMNTYGGTVSDADSMRSAILYAQIPVYVYIDNNAASAGALIALACDKIYMRKGANIGAATVVNEAGEELPDKYQSYMRSIIRATAEAQGKDTIINKNDTIYKWKRNPKIAEAMVDKSIFIPNVTDSGKVLSLTAEEALKLNFCDGIAENTDEVITKYLGHKKYELKTYEPSFYDNIKGFLLNPVLQAILIMIIIAGIYFELQTPGMGFPSIAAIIAAILYFSPLYIDGLAQHWEIIIFVLGIILVLLEIFVVPGFGITGISGITFIILGLILAALNNDFFSFKEVSNSQISRSVLTVLSGLILSFIAFIYLSSKIGNEGIFKKLALNADLEKSESINSDNKLLIGCIAETITILRPSGKILIKNEIYDAISDSGFIEKGVNVEIIRYENMQLYVKPLLS